eukprot:TRINITY_DN5984_c0_g3_i1.p1 TRINITY_DN5984_c0_g3~~TRINITY_DN5984_c0_g3_i1.p1  ORF type:complete len:203 (+),score=65.49 TRINITY_DN5984_c0_g3_i1:51-659(+)
MENIDDFYKRSQHAESSSLEMKQLVKAWHTKLNTLPLSKLKQLKLWQQTEVTNSSSKPLPVLQQRQNAVERIRFVMNYKTEYGLVGVMIGSAEVLGSWTPAKSYKMSWTEGNNWVADIPTAKLGDEFEYKYAIQNLAKMSIDKWEKGENRKWSVKSLEMLLNESINSSHAEQTSEFYFEHNGVKMIYINNKKELILREYWKA